MKGKKVGMFETSPSWVRCILGPLFFGIGTIALLLCSFLLIGWVSGIYDYEVPHACAAGQCQSAYGSSTGTCENFPPIALKMSGISGALWVLSRIAGLALALAGLLLARCNFQLAWRCAKPALPAPRPLLRVPCARLAIPFTALLITFLSFWSLKPSGLFSI
ncbi:MAG: hypothetical protein GY930_12110 [bacterium]|nr:hypothetical protein [bacterium]